MSATTVGALANNARCFFCIGEADLLRMQTYMFAFANGNTDPNSLARLAKCFQCLSIASLYQIRTYLLALAQGGSTDPAVLAQSAACFECIPVGMISAVETYLLTHDPMGPGITDPNALSQAARGFLGLSTSTLLEIQVYLLSVGLGQSTDPNVLAGLAKCFSCYNVPLMKQVQVNMIDTVIEDGGSVLDHGVPTPPVDCGTPTNYLVVSGAGTAAANGVYTLAGSTYTNSITGYQILKPNGGWVIYNPAIASILYRIGDSDFPCGTWMVVNGAGPQPSVEYTTVGMINAVAFDNRVIVNGGSAITVNTKNALRLFWDAILGASLDTKLLHVNCLVPDGLIACLTPFIVGNGSNPWTNHGYVSGDLTVNGIAGAAAHWADTGFTGLEFPQAFSMGITEYVHTGLNENSIDTGVVNAGGNDGVELTASYANDGIGHLNSTLARMNDVTPGASIFAVNSAWQGFLSVSRTAQNAIQCWKASSVVPFVSIGTNAAVITDDRAIFNGPCYFNALNLMGTGAFGIGSRRISFYALHLGLNATETQNLYNAVQALRVNLGGGYR